MRYVRLFREAIEKYQPVVERLMGVEIGNVELLPQRSRVATDFSQGSFRYSFSLAGVPVDNLKEARAVVRYNDCFILNLLPKLSIEFTAAHELGHIGHFNGRRLVDLMRVEKDVVEDVANYVAVSVLGTSSIPFRGDVPQQSYETISKKIKESNLPVKEALTKIGFSKPGLIVLGR